ncbi:amylo-alpha-1,6-glucosidase [Lysobacter soli]|uniref:amylo-alpha-1,6-glucosidase n=1 Tax=Lysobacter soli TaxID=453783 RepID=UPI00240FB164|nr:amylo-alpha-1,6-glucosidase [Lysobacter soli]MDG2519658.1 amylo-alpha-1,6-glucosidase [Lysobacter soli]
MDPAAAATLFSSYVLKDGDTFLIANGSGDVVGEGDGQFHNDTRVLSRFRLTLGDTAPALLSSMVSRDNVFFVAHLTNRALPPLGGDATPHGLVHIKRTRFLCADRLFERVALTNYGTDAVRLHLAFDCDADFRDMFEVRGTHRAARGQQLPPHPREDGLTFGYVGLDGAPCRASIVFSRAPQRVDDGRLAFDITLPPRGRDELYLEVSADDDPPPATRSRYRAAASVARTRMRRRQRRLSRVRSEAPLFNSWMERSRADLALLTSELDTGPYPYAGIPWFSTPFGRDAVITALQTLWLDPQLARGVLAFLAKNQAKEESSFMDASPGKIMHETRKGEMARLRELPFGLYYGGVDTTPLFLVLASEYARRTGDVIFIRSIWNELKAAAAWIERVCDANPLGFLDYARGEATGLANQGWKDSFDSVFHADGRSPQGPIALVEVQGYVFAAMRGMSRLALALGEDDSSKQWLWRSERIAEAVEQHFWMESGFYGIAVDGENALCAVRASNPGHLLYMGLPKHARAQAVSTQLMSQDFFSGWGIRTLAVGEARYNPMSYHNGSVWPHDSALCAAGLARYGQREPSVRLLRAAFEAAVGFDMRLPELFCGFPRVPGGAPVAYPVACLPQAWAAGSAFMSLQACLGIEIDGPSAEIVLDHPRLPAGVEELSIRNLTLGERRAHLVLKRVADRVAVFVEGPDAAGVVARVRG